MGGGHGPHVAGAQIHIGQNEPHPEGIEKLVEILSQNMDEQDLFLTAGFKSNISLKTTNDTY